MDAKSLPFTKENLEAYLGIIMKTDVRVMSISQLDGKKREKRIKGYGYGQPLLITVGHSGTEEKFVFHTIREDKFGHERPSDRAASLLLDHASFNLLPKHVGTLDVGAILEEDGLLSIGKSQEFFLLTNYQEGELYAEDLKRIQAEGSLQDVDRQRVLLLADYLADIHALEHSHVNLYQRRIRDLFGHGEGIFGIIDSYPEDDAVASRERLRDIEKKLIDWRWKLKTTPQRLSQVHGDFHPWNVLFQENQDFVVLDRSRGIWGEPADDISAMSINYLFFSLQMNGGFEGPFKILFDLFWDRYLDSSRDKDVLEIISPYYIWRALVLADPVWYPNLEDALRMKLFKFIDHLLETERFQPKEIERYLEREDQ